MATSLSSKKRIRQNQKSRAVNRWRKRRIHNAVKEFESAVHGGAFEQAQEAYRKAASVLDRVAGKGTIHPNKAARKKSRLARRLNALRASAA